MSNYVSSISKEMSAASYPEIAQLRKMTTGMTDLIDLGLGDSNLDTPEHIKEAGKQAIDHNKSHYTAVPGLPELRKAVAGKFAKIGVSYDPQTEVVVLPGAIAGLPLAMLSVLNRGDEVIMSDPCFSPYVGSIMLAGGKVVHVPLKEERDFRMDPADIRNKVTSKTKLIVIVSPDNPSGAVLTEEDVKSIAEIARENDLLVMSDQLYGDLMFDGRKNPTIACLPGMRDRTITLDGASKTYAMTGWRVGWMLANAQIVSAVVGFHSLFAYTANTMAQYGAIAALTGSQKPVQDMAREFQDRRDVLVNGLNQIRGVSCKKSGGGYYVFPSVRGTGMSSFEFAKRTLEKAHVLVYPATAFGKGGEGYLRVGFISQTKNSIKEAVDRMKKAF